MTEPRRHHPRQAAVFFLSALVTLTLYQGSTCLSGSIPPARTSAASSATLELRLIQGKLHAKLVNDTDQGFLYSRHPPRWKFEIRDQSGVELANSASFFARRDYPVERESDWRVLGRGETHAFIIPHGPLDLKGRQGTAAVTYTAGKKAAVPDVSESLPPLSAECLWINERSGSLKCGNPTARLKSSPPFAVSRIAILLALGLAMLAGGYWYIKSQAIGVEPEAAE